METLESIRRRVKSAEDLFGIVRTMKALAAASIRQFENAVEAVEVYTQTVEMGLQFVLQDHIPQTGEATPRQIGRNLAIIFGSDQGMCGQFNENIVSFALQDIKKNRETEEKISQIVVGLRAASYIEETGGSFRSMFSVPSSVDGITPAVQTLFLNINNWLEQEAGDKVLLYYNRPLAGAAYQPVKVQLMPVNMQLFQSRTDRLCSSNNVPFYTLERDQLIPALLRQFLFAQLYRAYAQSLTSENASRLMTMQAAEKNIEERLDDLNALYHTQRQNSITSELLDIISGVEALSAATD